MIVYYAHSQTTYGSKQEQADLLMLRRLGILVYNPNNGKDEKMFQKHGMEYFDLLASDHEFDAIFYRTYREGIASYGTGYEVRWAQERGIPTFEITDTVQGYSSKETKTAYAAQGRDDLARLYE